MKIDWTKPIETRAGERARLVATLKGGTFPRIVVVTDENGEERCDTFTEAGRLYEDGADEDHDLVNAPPDYVQPLLDELAGFQGWAEGVYMTTTFRERIERVYAAAALLRSSRGN